jgi:hypothetical protein
MFWANELVLIRTKTGKLDFHIYFECSLLNIEQI